MKREKVIEMGYDAYLNGKDIKHSNPYPQSMQEYAWFENGWKQAKRDDFESQQQTKKRI